MIDRSFWPYLVRALTVPVAGFFMTFILCALSDLIGIVATIITLLSICVVGMAVVTAHDEWKKRR